jgi:hypothetical protein
LAEARKRWFEVSKCQVEDVQRLELELELELEFECARVQVLARACELARCTRMSRAVPAEGGIKVFRGSAELFGRDW